MSEYHELYQQVIVDHGRRPRNFCVCEGANRHQRGVNPMCGDQLTVHVREAEGIIEAASFQGEGCAISMASASLMTEAVSGMHIDKAQALSNQVKTLVKGEPQTGLGKLAALAGVCEYPSRVKCATLAWHALEAALANHDGAVSTEGEQHA